MDYILFYYSKYKYYSIINITFFRLSFNNIRNRLSGIHFVSMCAKMLFKKIFKKKKIVRREMLRND